MRKVVALTILVILSLGAPISFAETKAVLSNDKVKAGQIITISGSIDEGDPLNIVISSEPTFSPENAAGPKEKVNLIEAAEQWDYTKDTCIPYLYYIITSDPHSFGSAQDKRYGGAFFFKGLYRTQMFELKKWQDLSESVKKDSVVISNQQQWNLLRYAHENVYGINTIGKERTCRGKEVIFSRCVVSDYSDYPYYWNLGTRIQLDKKTGNFTATFQTFRHTAPNTSFIVYANGTQVGKFIVEPDGFWLSRGWRYKNPLLIVLCAIIAGTLYSMLGASGGLIMAALQVIFIGTAGPMGVDGANVLKPSNLPLMFFAPLSGLYRYWLKERRLVMPIAWFFAAGLLIGSFWIGPPLSAKYLNLTVYKPWLGVFVLIMAIRTLYELSHKVMKKRESVKKVTQAYSLEAKKAKEEGRELKMGQIKTVKFGLFNYRFTFWGQHFKCNLALFFFIGIFIGVVNAAFGIGGGFILVPVMTMFAGLPMYLVVPISLFASIVGTIAAVPGYILIGYYPDLWIVLSIVIGGTIGGQIGSKLNHCFSEKQLKIALASILFFLVFRFLGIEIWI